MIDEARTLELFGYTSDSLTHGSNKKVCAVCDECGKVRFLPYNTYRKICRDCSPQSEETRKKVSEGQKGKKLSEATKKKISEAAKGRKASVETRNKMSEKRRGRKNTDESRKNMSTAQTKSWAGGQRKNTRGDNNPNWRGGISFEPYCPKFDEAFKELIREKFGRICFLCPTTEGENGQKLSVHHVNYDKTCLCDDVKCEFVPLCNSCHSKTNFDREYWENLIIEKLK